MEKIPDIDRHRVMIKHAKVHNWELWFINQSRWTERHYDEFDKVRNGENPSLLAGTVRKGSFMYLAKKGDISHQGSRKELAKILGCHHSTISQSAEIGRKFNGFKITRI